MTENARIPLLDRDPSKNTKRRRDMKVLLIVNNAPSGSEKTYNAIRLAMALQKDHPGTDVRIFLLADAVTAANFLLGINQGLCWREPYPTSWASSGRSRRWGD